MRQTIFSFLLLFPALAFPSCCLQQAEAKMHLAHALLKDQQHGAAFQALLEALDAAPLSAMTMSPREEELYKEALEIYLEHRGVLSYESASLIRHRFAPIVERHPDYLALTFLLALAHASLDNTDDFFTLFYRAYCAYPEHYFSYKIKGILHIKLFERMPFCPEREITRQHILDNLVKAGAIFSGDPSLYMLLVLFSGEQNKKEHLSASLNKIIDENIILSRGEIKFYANCAKDCQLDELAGRFLEAAKKWYPNSRSLEQMVSK